MIIDVLKQKFPQVEGLRVRDIVVDKADKRISCVVTTPVFEYHVTLAFVGRPYFPRSGTHDDFTLTVLLTHEDIFNRRAVRTDLLDEEDATPAHCLNKASGGNTVDIVALLELLSRALNLIFCPRRHCNRNHAHQDDHRHGKSQNRNDPTQQTQSAGTEPNGDFAILPTAHHDHQDGNED